MRGGTVVPRPVARSRFTPRAFAAGAASASSATSPLHFVFEGNVSAINAIDGSQQSEIQPLHEQWRLITNPRLLCEKYAVGCPDSLKVFGGVANSLSISNEAGIGTNGTHVTSKTNTTFASSPTDGAVPVTVYIAPDGDEQIGDRINVRIDADAEGVVYNATGSFEAKVSYTGPEADFTHDLLDLKSSGPFPDVTVAPDPPMPQTASEVFPAKIGDKIGLSLTILLDVTTSGQADTVSGGATGASVTFTQLPPDAPKTIVGTPTPSGGTTQTPPDTSPTNPKPKKPKTPAKPKHPPKPKAHGGQNGPKHPHSGTTSTTPTHGQHLGPKGHKPHKPKTVAVVAPVAPPPVTVPVVTIPTPTPPPVVTPPVVVTPPPVVTPPVTTPTPPPVANPLTANWAGTYSINTGNPVPLTGGMTFSILVSADGTSASGSFTATNLFVGTPFGSVPFASAERDQAAVTQDPVTSDWTVTGTLVPDDPTIPESSYQEFVAIVSSSSGALLGGSFDFVTTPIAFARGAFQLARQAS